MIVWPTECFLRPMRGFTLIELSLGLLIMALLSSGLLLGLAAQRDIADQQAALVQLDTAREALLGFALTTGRLPCPARPDLPESDPAAGLEDCSRQHGVLPWLALALPALDPWGQRLTYYASERFTAALSEGSLASFSLDTLGNANIYDSQGKLLAGELPVVLVSHGRNGAGAYLATGQRVVGASGEENENADADLTFVSHPPTQAFDDQLVWLIPSLLKARLVSAGRLP